MLTGFYSFTTFVTDANEIDLDQYNIRVHFAQIRFIYPLRLLACSCKNGFELLQLVYEWKTSLGFKSKIRKSHHATLRVELKILGCLLSRAIKHCGSMRLLRSKRCLGEMPLLNVFESREVTSCTLSWSLCFVSPVFFFP